MKSYRKIAEKQEYEQAIGKIHLWVKHYDPKIVSLLKKQDNKSMSLYETFILNPRSLEGFSLEGFSFEGADKLDRLEELLQRPYLPRDLLPDEIKIIKPQGANNHIFGVFFRDN